MALESIRWGSTGDCSWHFENRNGQIHFSITVSGVVSQEFANKVLADAVIRKDKAIKFGDGISLDLVLAGLRKEAINDFGQTLKD